MTMSAIAPVPVSTPASTTPAPSNASRWTARILAGLAVAFLVFDTSLKLFALAPAVEASKELGYPPGAFLWIGIVELACLALYVVPRTAPIGAILWTGYLGGAIATHVRLGNPLFSHTLFPIYVAVMLWLPLWLRDARVRGLLGPRGA
ncbi:DoxX family protein [Sorangium sp. So ce260]|uniref:DoxX family protein n=1 Tax=unclassified Sorangium TaxID=2621164 RepID=UPI003F612B10